jgi:hypothetical protein
MVGGNYHHTILHFFILFSRRNFARLLISWFVQGGQ